ncbi:exo-alpha-sialidase [bacterium]|nr:exo-alpha-sialidase [bacterium]
MNNLERIDLFVSGEYGYSSYRIPAILVSNNGTILVFCEGRKYSASDTGDIDIILRRSTDGGKTWEEPRVIADAGKDVFGNPAPVLDRRTGTIYLLLTWNLAEKGERAILTESAPRTVWLMKSVDDGKTWSSPIEITKYVKREDWTWYATGPGHGIQLKNGRLIIPCDHAIRLSQGEIFDPKKHYYSHIIYSDDGVDWHIGGTVPRGGTNECQVAELSDGSLYLSMRNYDGSYRRAYSISGDNGITWGKVKIDEALIDPICQASIISDSNRGIVVFCNPSSLKRENLTLRISYDGCRSWSKSITLYEGPSAYSDLALLDDMLFCVYENGNNSPYERISLTPITMSIICETAL